MKSTRVFSVLATLLMGMLMLLTTLSSPIPTAQADSDNNKYAAAQIIFTLKDASSLQAVNDKFEFSSIKSLGSHNTYLAIFDDKINPRNMASKMVRDPRIKYAEPNYIMGYVANSTNFGFDANNFAFDSGSLISGSSSSSPQAIWNANNQWAWQKINLSATGRWNQGNSVKIAVLDTGVNYNLPDFGGSVKTGWSNSSDNGRGQDLNGHGTFVAGVIHQVAPSATILPVQVLDSQGNGTLSAVLDGINWARYNGATVMNMSFSSASYSEILAQVIYDLTSSDIVVVASAGNENRSIPYYPAALNGVISVASTDQNDLKASFSNFGSYVTLSAPGTNIYSMYWKGGYATADGTSFSAPMIAAEAALYKSIYPSAGLPTVRKALTNATTSFPALCLVPLGNCLNQLGLGRIDFSRLN